MAATAHLNGSMNGHAFPQSSGSFPSHSHAHTDPRYSKLLELYSSAGQGHVLTFFDRLNPAEQSALLDQLETIDVRRVNRIYQHAVAADAAPTPPPHHQRLDDDHGSLGVSVGPNLIGRSRTPSPGPEEVHPLPDEACASIVSNPAAEAKWRDIGLRAIANNQVAVLLMAGGQGTRLGSTSPKGMYDIHLPSGNTLFVIQAARIKRLQKVAAAYAGKSEQDVQIRWYVMTSGPTKVETQKYFDSTKYFGLSRDQVIFFEQGVLPALSESGQLLLSSPSSVSVAPDGNGGLYAALRRPISASSSRTVLSDLRAHNIEYIHAYCVDNCLVRVADPTFVGCCIDRQAECGAKVVRKTVPSESVGVLAKRGDKFSVVEYSELSKEKAEARTSDGQLAFRAANIANHFFTMKFLESIEAMEKRMAFHIARKKIATIDLETGERIVPSSPNGMKLEMFVFDVFPFTQSLCVLEVERQEEFSPLKNAPGSKSDCPETSRRDLLAQQRRWVLSAGAEVADDAEVELTPEVTYAGEGLEWLRGKKIRQSGVIRSPEDADALL